MVLALFTIAAAIAYTATMYAGAVAETFRRAVFARRLTEL
jgi:hypothetical protein